MKIGKGPWCARLGGVWTRAPLRTPPLRLHWHSGGWGSTRAEKEGFVGRLEATGGLPGSMMQSPSRSFVGPGAGRPGGKTYEPSVVAPAAGRTPLTAVWRRTRGRSFFAPRRGVLMQPGKGGADESTAAQNTAGAAAAGKSQKDAGADLVRKIARDLEDKCGVARSCRLVVGVSGGSDSIALVPLLFLLKKGPNYFLFLVEKALIIDNETYMYFLLCMRLQRAPPRRCYIPELQLEE